MMKMIIEELTIDTQDKFELINITNQINNIIYIHEIKSGLINISTKHTTSSIIINEDEEGLKKDFISIIEEVIPDKNYNHDCIDNNAKSHLMSMLTTPNQTIPIINGKLSLGIWQSIFFLELDGPRKNRKVIITIIQ